MDQAVPQARGNERAVGQRVQDKGDFAVVNEVAGIYEVIDVDGEMPLVNVIRSTDSSGITGSVHRQTKSRDGLDYRRQTT